ncbi:hypothetical protein EJB05_31789 [Eragrostis curvula]|uniref:Bowman-Birk serine protease inhibitors family domain-containing protein n=1 Tax=Eragrostis curvula TaxID=38414 RepID=A0A5J9UFK0_9POAL|nr:hypothetical protein EJB05_31789 [Eragrostis curvula]
MEKRVASILLMLSVQALLVVAGLCAAAGSGDTDIIRLPSESEGNNEKPPWKCCNDAQCTKSWPPICRCMDKVEHCSHACKKCVDVEGSSKACADWYRGHPPPRCDEDQENNVVHGDVVVPGARKEDDKERPPWKCCNNALCTKSWPPICRCMDTVEQCSHACKECVDVEGSGKACADWYRGQAPPRCDEDRDNNVVRGDVVVPGARKEDDKERPPWKCCNDALCTKSWPPICRCMDKVEHCSHACKKCVDVEGSSKACEDWYHGQPPPRCDEDQQNNVVHVVVPGARKESDGERPWKCCNRPVIGPSTSETPVWYCLDKFEHCDCEHCSKVDKGHGYHCLDGYKGSNPGPSCSHDG